MLAIIIYTPNGASTNPKKLNLEKKHEFNFNLKIEWWKSNLKFELKNQNRESKLKIKVENKNWKPKLKIKRKKNCISKLKTIENLNGKFKFKTENWK